MNYVAAFYAMMNWKRQESNHLTQNQNIAFTPPFVHFIAKDIATFS